MTKKDKFKNKLKEQFSNILFNEKKIPTSKTKNKKKKEEPEEEEVKGDEEGMNMDIENSDIQVNPVIGQIQKALNLALKGAQQIGDQKLIKQVGNTLTFLTRMQVNQGDSLMEGFATPLGRQWEQRFEVIGRSVGSEYSNFDEFIEDNSGASNVLLQWVEEKFSSDLINFFNEEGYTKEEVEELGFYGIADEIENKEDEEDEDMSKYSSDYHNPNDPESETDLKENQENIRFKVGEEVYIPEWNVNGTVEQLPNYPTRPNYYIYIKAGSVEEGLYSFEDKDLEPSKINENQHSEMMYDDEFIESDEIKLDENEEESHHWTPEDEAKQKAEYENSKYHLMYYEETGDAENGPKLDVDFIAGSDDKEKLKQLAFEDYKHRAEDYGNPNQKPALTDQGIPIGYQIVENSKHPGHPGAIDFEYDKNGYIDDLDENEFSRIQELAGVKEYGLEHDPEKVDDEDFEHSSLEKRKKKNMKEEDELKELGSTQNLEDGYYTSDDKDMSFQYWVKGDKVIGRVNGKYYKVDKNFVATSKNSKLRDLNDKELETIDSEKYDKLPDW